MKYNTTQLHPERELERHVFHRDQFAHLLRWTHVLNIAKMNQNILDFGCGNANLLKLLWTNKYKPNLYLGLDVREKQIEKLKKEYFNLPYAQFQVQDLCKEFRLGNDFDIIVCFEVIEHIGKENVDAFLRNIKRHTNPNTKILLSTPVYDENVGAANNHMIDGKVGEFTFDELKNHLVKHFDIEDVWGTFASQKDYKPHMNDWQKNMYNHLIKYYDVNLVSNLMAPFFPEQSRNCVWQCSRKELA